MKCVNVERREYLLSLVRGKEKERRWIRYNRKEIYVDGKMSRFEVENFEVR